MELVTRILDGSISYTPRGEPRGRRGWRGVRLAHAGPSSAMPTSSESQFSIAFHTKAKLPWV